MKNLILLTMLSAPAAVLLPATLAHAGTHKVTYEIPVPEALEPFSKFEVEYTATKRADGVTELVYKLPRVLLGRDTEFRFLGRVDFSAKHFDFKAPNAGMRCEPGEAVATCKVGYSAVKVDLEGVREALEELPITPAEKLGRFEVASLIARSGGDFAGFLQFIRDPEYRLFEE